MSAAAKRVAEKARARMICDASRVVVGAACVVLVRFASFTGMIRRRSARGDSEIRDLGG